LDRLKVIILASILMALICSEARGYNMSYIPSAGLSLPVGDKAQEWRAGYLVSLDIFHPVRLNFDCGGRVSFQRWKPDAEEMLRVGSRDFKVERNIGWQALGELSGVARYRLLSLSRRSIPVWVEGGVGLFYLKWPDIEVKGFSSQNDVALNREIFRDEGSEVVPGLSAGLSVELLGAVEPTLRFQHIFSSDGGMNILFIGLGLLAH